MMEEGSAAEGEKTVRKNESGMAQVKKYGGDKRDEMEKSKMKLP